jgi:hypothetical protein
MRLKDYDNPSEHEMEAAFREVYYFAQDFTRPAKILVWLILRMMGDRLYRRIAQKMHSETMSTLNDVGCGMHSDVFERKRKERAEIRKSARGFVRAEIVE